MRNRLIFAILSISLLLLGIASIKSKFYPSLSSVSTQKLQLVGESASPDGDYTLKTYLIGGPLLRTDFSFIGEVEFNKRQAPSRKVFWIDGSRDNSEPTARWVDTSTIMVDGRTLNVLEDSYDFRW